MREKALSDLVEIQRFRDQLCVKGAEDIEWANKILRERQDTDDGTVNLLVDMSGPHKQSVGLRIRALRLAARLERPQAAKLLGVDATTLYHWEVGKRDIAVTKLVNISVKLDAPLDFLATGAWNFNGVDSMPCFTSERRSKIYHYLHDGFMQRLFNKAMRDTSFEIDYEAIAQLSQKLSPEVRRELNAALGLGD